jgi:hypothetical protein
MSLYLNLAPSRTVLKEVVFVFQVKNRLHVDNRYRVFILELSMDTTGDHYSVKPAFRTLAPLPHFKYALALL